jgi:hypothetical protein
MIQMRLLMRSTYGRHLDIPSWSPVPPPHCKEGGQQLTLLALELGKTKFLTFLVSIEIPVLFPRQKQNIFG